MQVIGIHVGLTQVESYGVMDGWDHTATQHCHFRSMVDRPGYAEGYELGCALYETLVEWR